MNSQEQYQYLKKAASLLALDLQASRERLKLLERALEEVFPFEAYKLLRPDVENAFQNDKNKLLEHYLDWGINEMSLMEEVDRNHSHFYHKMASSCLRDTGITTFAKLVEDLPHKNRQFIKTMGSVENLKVNQDHIFALKFTSLHYNSNTVCTWIPKNACSNLRYSIAKENGAIGSLEEIEWIHQNNETFCASNKEILLANYSFIILRNPFKRLLSFFCDKLCHEGTNSDLSYESAKKLFGSGSETSFIDFINFIWQNPESIYKDIHTRPQVDYLVYRDYDDYFSLENYAKAKEKILIKTGIGLVDVRESNSIFTTKNCNKSSEFTYLVKSKEVEELLLQRKKPIPENMYSDEMSTLR